jgi:hypothetical protein
MIESNVHDDYLVVGGAQESPSHSLVLLSLSNPSAPTVVKALSRSFRVSNVRIDSNGNVFVAAHADGMRTMTLQTILNQP